MQDDLMVDKIEDEGTKKMINDDNELRKEEMKDMSLQESFNLVEPKLM